jgi:hypothetical protein
MRNATSAVITGVITPPARWAKSSREATVAGGACAMSSGSVPV